MILLGRLLKIVLNIILIVVLWLIIQECRQIGPKGGPTMCFPLGCTTSIALSLSVITGAMLLLRSIPSMRSTSFSIGINLWTLPCMIHLHQELLRSLLAVIHSFQSLCHFHLSLAHCFPVSLYMMHKGASVMFMECCNSLEKLARICGSLSSPEPSIFASISLVCFLCLPM
jgi:hypothetical protein